SVARLLEALPDRLPPDVIANDHASHDIWELVGRFYMVTRRLHEALAVFWGLYQQMLKSQARSGQRIHKGMPLVWMAECYVGLGFAVHAKRYLMLTLCEDALRENGTVNPETTGTYFRLVWAHGLSDSDISRYARDFYALAEAHPSRAGFPEALLQEIDDD